MRTLVGHKTNPANEALMIEADDELGPGGAPHRYVIIGYNAASNSAHRGRECLRETQLVFQNGPIGEAGVNGITHEALIEILCDRLRHFQRGPFASRENALALTKLEEAQLWLLARTRRREELGIEGTHEVDPA